jgi:hypothetical protein
VVFTITSTSMVQNLGLLMFLHKVGDTSRDYNINAVWKTVPY